VSDFFLYLLNIMMAPIDASATPARPANVEEELSRTSVCVRQEVDPLMLARVALSEALESFAPCVALLKALPS
jgi:hypothetical protein